jgi:sulfur-carrier protein
MYIRLYATLRDLTGVSGVDVGAVKPSPVRAVLRRVVAACPALGEQLWDGDELLTGQVKVLVNGRMIGLLQGLETPVCEGDDVKLFPPVGGG